MALWSYLGVTTKLSSEDEDSDNYGIIIKLQYCNSHSPKDRTVTVILPAIAKDPQYLQLEFLLEYLQDSVTKWLQGFHGHQADCPAIINDLALSCLQLLQRSNNTNSSSSDNGGDNSIMNNFVYIVHLLGEEYRGGDPTKVIKLLLAAAKMIVVSNAAVKDCVMCSCSICLEDVVIYDDNGGGGGMESATMVKSRCAHVYHKDCIIEWILKSGIDAFCPMCRLPLFDTITVPN